MKNTTRFWIVPALLFLAGCGSTRTTEDPADRIGALVVAGKYDAAVSEFLQLPLGTSDESYIRAANAASLACATIASQQDDPIRRQAWFREADRILPDITRGRYRIPASSKLRAEMETAQAIVRTTIKYLKARGQEAAPE